MPDFGASSAERGQCFGMCQGRPLAPLLTTVAMATLTADARRELRLRLPDLTDADFVRELIYPGDALLLDAGPVVAGELTACAEGCGKRRGLSLNWRSRSALALAHGRAPEIAG